jgi:predicted RNase H-like HicB family nuclease
MKYKVILHHTEEGISICVPSLPGCWSEDEALANIQDAIREYLAALQDRIPENRPPRHQVRQEKKRKS